MAKVKPKKIKRLLGSLIVMSSAIPNSDETLNQHQIIGDARHALASLSCCLAQLSKDYEGGLDRLISDIKKGSEAYLDFTNLTESTGEENG